MSDRLCVFCIPDSSNETQPVGGTACARACRRASTGDALSTAKKRGGVGGRGKGVKAKGKKAKTARRRKSTGGLAAISDSSERDDDNDEDDDEDWA